jgi:hypothetical protein
MNDVVTEPNLQHPALARPRRAAQVLLLLLAAAVTAGCASLRSQACRANEDLVVADTLYFGTNKPGGTVSADEWQDFLATGVTPRFPQGITSWRATGQWRSASGELEHESSYVLQLVHADTTQTERAVREVMDLYRKRFEQEAVLRVRLPACTSFK